VRHGLNYLQIQDVLRSQLVVLQECLQICFVDFRSESALRSKIPVQGMTQGLFFFSSAVAASSSDGFLALLVLLLVVVLFWGGEDGGVVMLHRPGVRPIACPRLVQYCLLEAPPDVGPDRGLSPAKP
jgi:hypothetical protein